MLDESTNHQTVDLATDLVEKLAEQQRIDWNGGIAKTVESYLENFPYGEHHDHATLELCYNEILLRQGTGQKPKVEEYVHRFPQYERQLRRQFEVHEFFEESDSNLPKVADSVDDQRDTSWLITGSTPPVEATRYSQRQTTSPSVAPEIPGYEICRLIGRGGTGLVYLAIQVSTGQEVAIKILHAAESATDDEVRRFRQESQAIARLNHPAIVRVFDAGVANRVHYIVMEWIDGGTLAERVDGSPLRTDHAVDIAIELSEAIAIAHASGVIHRDIKPQNILISSDGKPRVVDFGLAKFQECSYSWTQTGQLVGTLPFMSPEQASGRGDEIGIRTDVYGIGAVLYFMLCGRPPHIGESLTETLAKVAQRSPDPIPQENTSADLRTVCLKCLQKDKSDRYASAVELASDLRCVREGNPVAARPLSVTAQWYRMAKRNPLVAGLLGAVAIATLLMTLGSIAAAIKFRHDSHKLRSMVERVTQAQLETRNALAESYVIQAEQRVQNNAAGVVGDCKRIVSRLHESESDTGIDSDQAIRMRNALVEALSRDDIQEIQPAETLTEPDGTKLIRRMNGFTAQLDSQDRMVIRDDQSETVASSEPIAGTLLFWEWLTEDKLVIASTKGVMLMNSSDARIETIPLTHDVQGAEMHDRYGLLAVWSGRYLSIIDIDRNNETITRYHDTGRILSIAWHPDKPTLAMGSDDHFAYVFVACKLHQPRMVIEGSRTWVDKVAFLNSGELAVSSQREDRSRVFDITSFDECLTFDGSISKQLSNRLDGTSRGVATSWSYRSSPIRWKLRDENLDFAIASSGAFSPDERLLVLCNWEGATLWDYSRRKKMDTITLDEPLVARFVDDRSIVFVNSDGMFRCMVEPDGKASPPKRIVFDEIDVLGCVDIKPLQMPGAFFFNCEDEPLLARIDSDKHEIESLSVVGNVVAIQQSPNGELRGYVDDKNTFRLIDLTTGQVLLEKRLADEHLAIRFTNDSRRCAILTSSQCLLLNTVNPREIQFLSLDESINEAESLQFDPTGRILAIANSSGDIQLFEASSGRSKFKLPSRYSSSWMCFAGHGDTLITRDSVYRFNAWNLKSLHEQLEEFEMDSLVSPQSDR